MADEERVVQEKKPRRGLRRSVVLLMLQVIILVAALDQLTKQLILEYFKMGQAVQVIKGFFNITLHFNPGAAFGLMSGLSDGLRQVALGITAALAIACVVFFLLKDYLEDKIGQVALAMVLGGALGNLIDRLVIGEVVDFLDFYVSAWHWPAFNLADSAICLGVFILLLRPAGRGRKTQPADQASCNQCQSYGSTQ